MTNTAPIALMAAALFLAVQGQPRADGEAMRGECPCGFTADNIRPEVWIGKVECKLGRFRAGDQTQLVALPPAGVFGSPTWIAPLYLRGFCIRRDADGILALKAQLLSKEEVYACDNEITVYAQGLKDLRDPRVRVVNRGCKLE